MNQIESRLPVIYLKTAEMIFTEQPASVLTVLGSCLAITMFHRPFGIGAICHGLLPQCSKKKTCNKGCKDEARYVECSIEQMISWFLRVDVILGEVEIKVFGGADMFSTRNDAEGPATVGKQNIETAMRLIKNKGLHIVAMDVGGEQGRKIFFNTLSGEVLLQRLPLNAVLRDGAIK